MVYYILICVIEALNIIRSDIEDVALVMSQSELTSASEVLGIDELVTVLAVSYKPELLVVVNELIKDRKTSMIVGHLKIMAFTLSGADNKIFSPSSLDLP